MDFGLFPPEINSGRMYTGPGAGPMLAAAAVWDGLPAGFDSTATSGSSVAIGYAPIGALLAQSHRGGC